MGLVEELYAYEDEERKNIWRISPFSEFAPALSILNSKHVKQLIKDGRDEFYKQDIRNNFFPDKSPDEAIEGMRHAMNKGLGALNTLCRRNLGGIYELLVIPHIGAPLKPAEFFAEAKDNLIRAKLHPKSISHNHLISAYNAVRSWGLGHLVLIIDESPEIFQSIVHREMISKWMSERFNFGNPLSSSHGLTSWDTEAKIKVYGRDEPFRHRAKIHDEKENIRYGSLLMKMFRKNCFLDGIYDNYGIEMLVENDESAKRLLHFFSSELRRTAHLEKYEEVRSENPPFRCYKFILRVPIRLDPNHDASKMEDEHCPTVKHPITRYIRLPVEVQIRSLDNSYDHEAYKKRQYMEVFPLWYPKEIYGPTLRTTERIFYNLLLAESNIQPAEGVKPGP
jgi:hypothetical protein